MDPLPLDNPRMLAIPMYLKLCKLHQGSEAVVWEDRDQGVLFKQFFDEEIFRNEVQFYNRLKGIGWVPTLLGTVSERHRWGIFLTFEGQRLEEEEWNDPSSLDYVKGRVIELHKLGIHHHDLAPRNVLRRPNGTLVITDFGLAMNADDCCEGEGCPDFVV